MQPQTPQPTPELNTPQSSETLPRPITPEVGSTSKPEKAPLPAERSPTPGGDRANQNAGAPAVAVPQPIAPPAAPRAVPTADDGTPAVADDVDLIEKEWVRVAKSVVEQTREDPHRQSAELGKVKASYVKKRYSKDIPTPKPVGQEG